MRNDTHLEALSQTQFECGALANHAKGVAQRSGAAQLNLAIHWFAEVQEAKPGEAIGLDATEGVVGVI